MIGRVSGGEISTGLECDRSRNTFSTQAVTPAAVMITVNKK
jgi:hypothetical protein